MVNQWILHVKQYASDNNMSYGCAISEASGTYVKKAHIKDTLKTVENRRNAVNATINAVKEKQKIKEMRQALKTINNKRDVMSGVSKAANNREIRKSFIDRFISKEENEREKKKKKNEMRQALKTINNKRDVMSSVSKAAEIRRIRKSYTDDWEDEPKNKKKMEMRQALNTINNKRAVMNSVPKGAEIRGIRKSYTDDWEDEHDTEYKKALLRQALQTLEKKRYKRIPSK